MSSSVYPVHVDAALDGRLSRWLWLVKWLLALPHYLVLAFLWPAFFVLSVFAFFAILFTGRYPRAMFDFNVGVLRWTWRVAYYAYGALGTDQYPPFTLAEVSDYPAHLTVEFPGRLSRGLVLVKWWLLALPHYLVVGLFLGGGVWVVDEASTNEQWRVQDGPGLIGLLVLVAAVVLLVTGRYPQQVFDFVLGLNRWVLRVAAYAALMTDDYPPFRLDMGGDDPRPPGTATLEPTPAAPATGTYRAASPPAQGARMSVPASREPAPVAWTAGRVVAVVAGALVFLAAGGLVVSGALLGVADRTMRNDAGFLMSPHTTVTTSTYAIVTEPLTLESAGDSDRLPEALLGEAVVEIDSSAPLFLGVARTADVERYLTGVEHDTLVDLRDGDEATYRQTPGAAPTTAPDAADIWVASTSGTGERSASWELEDGDWTIVLMNSDARPGITADVAVGATAPVLGWLVIGLLVSGALLLVLSIAIVLVALHGGRRSPGTVA